MEMSSDLEARKLVKMAEKRMVATDDFEMETASCNLAHEWQSLSDEQRSKTWSSLKSLYVDNTLAQVFLSEDRRDAFERFVSPTPSAEKDKTDGTIYRLTFAANNLTELKLFGLNYNEFAFIYHRTIALDTPEPFAGSRSPVYAGRDYRYVRECHKDWDKR